jgi:hypothetical protein
MMQLKKIMVIRMLIMVVVKSRMMMLSPMVNPLTRVLRLACPRVV